MILSFYNVYNKLNTDIPLWRLASNFVSVQTAAITQIFASNITYMVFEANMDWYWSELSVCKLQWFALQEQYVYFK